MCAMPALLLNTTTPLLLLAQPAQQEPAAAGMTMASFPSVDAPQDIPWTKLTEFATNALLINTGTIWSIPQFVLHALPTLPAAQWENKVCPFAVATQDTLLTNSQACAILASPLNILIPNKVSASTAQLEPHAASTPMVCSPSALVPLATLLIL